MIDCHKTFGKVCNYVHSVIPSPHSQLSNIKMICCKVTLFMFLILILCNFHCIVTVGAIKICGGV